VTSLRFLNFELVRLELTVPGKLAIAEFYPSRFQIGFYWEYYRIILIVRCAIDSGQ